MRRKSQWCVNCEQNVVAEDESNSVGAVVPRVGIALLLFITINRSSSTIGSAWAEDPSSGLGLAFIGIIIPIIIAGLLFWYLHRKFSVMRCPICKGTAFLPPKRRLRSKETETLRKVDDV